MKICRKLKKFGPATSKFIAFARICTNLNVFARIIANLVEFDLKFWLKFAVIYSDQDFCLRSRPNLSLRKKRKKISNFNKTFSLISTAKTSNALTTVQSLLLQIDETKHNASIVEALKMGTSTLKNALDDRNITVDNVEDALADVKEILDANAEIQFALSGAQFNDILNDGIDDESLEAELNDLLDDDKVETVAAAAGGSNGGATGGIGLPTVPSDIKQPVVARTQKPSTMTNVIDDLLEERLKKLEMGNTINVNIGANANKPVLAQGVHQ